MTSVCFVNMPYEYYSTVSGGAISTIIREVSRALRTLGHDVTIVSYTDGGTPSNEPVVSLGDFRAKSIGRRIVDRARERDVLGRYRRDVSDALRSLTSVPEVVIVFNDFDSPAFLHADVRDSAVGVWLQNDVVPPVDIEWSVVDFVLTCSHFIRGRVIERGAPAGKCFTTPSGVDIGAFLPRSDWLQPTDQLRVLCLGRFDPNKGHDLAVEAVRVLQSDGRSVTLTLAGAKWWYGDHTDPYGESLLTSLGSIGGRYAGLVDRHSLPTLVASHDACLVLSRSEEPFGLVVLEAMAGGLAVVATSRGGLPEACDGAALALVDRDDLEGVVAALRRIAPPDGSDLLAQVKQESRLRAERSPWTVTAEHLVRAVEIHRRSSLG